MIQLIVNLYRGAIGIIFVIGIGAALVSLTSGTTVGVLIGVGVFIATVLTVGLSAVLISINDRLATAQGASTSSSNTGRQIGVGIGIMAIVAINFAGLALRKTPEAPPADTTEAAANLQPQQADSNGCVPELAKSVGLKC